MPDQRGNIQPIAPATMATSLMPAGASGNRNLAGLISRPVEVAVPLSAGQPQPTVPQGPTPRRLRIALAHDWLCGIRGGEHVLERLATLISREHTLAGVYTMFDDGRSIGATVDAARHVVWPLGRIPGLRTSLRRWMLPLYPRAVWWLGSKLAAEHRRAPFDLVISTSSAAIKGLRAPKGVPHLCYCHSPARWVWSQTENYELGSRLRRAGLRWYGERFRRWDKKTSGNVARYIANSRHTAREVHRCYERDAAIVHPFVRLDKFTPDPLIARENFWLYVGALEPYKRVDLAIEAAQREGRELRIAGSGSELKRLKKLAGPNTKFLGRVTDSELVELYRRARLVVFPQVEDFGIVALEAQACGTPVIALAQGGALDTVLDGQTGTFFHDVTPESMAAASRRCPTDALACRAHAERFSPEQFDAEMLRQIDGVVNSVDAQTPVR